MSLSSLSLIHPKAFVPVHFYGQLVQTEEGCVLLEKVVRNKVSEREERGGGRGRKKGEEEKEEEKEEEEE